MCLEQSFINPGVFDVNELRGLLTCIKELTLRTVSPNLIINISSCSIQ